MRALPAVHAALRENDPSHATQSQPVVKKAPPSTGRPMPAGFYSDKEPPKIGTPVQPPPPTTSRPDAAQGLNLPLATTPITPGYPPRPSLDAIPKHPSMDTSSGANKHPLEPPMQQGPPNKQVRAKPFPHQRHLHCRPLWQNPQQLIDLNQALHAQRVLQQSTCQHHPRLPQCLRVLQQRNQSSM